jgi:small conductance mechanosensitive channel
MNIIILTNQVIFQSIYTLLVVVAIIAIFLLERAILKKEDLKKAFVFFIYIISLIFLFLGVGGILWIWNYNFSSYFESIGTDIVAFIEGSIGKIVGSLVTIFISLSITKISKMTLNKFGNKPGTRQKRKKTIAKVTASMIKYLVSIIMILIVLGIWGFNVAPAIAGLGILGLVIGLGAQKFINDLITGFFIIFEQHFDVGDIVEIQGFKGEVTSIGLKTTKIRNWKGDVKIINNGDVSNLINFSKNLSTAVVDFGIAYKEDVQKTIDLLTIELPKLKQLYPEIIEDPKVVGVIELANSSVNLRVIAKTMNEQHYAIERMLRLKIKEILDQNGIEIPFPQVVVHQGKS